MPAADSDPYDIEPAPPSPPRALAPPPVLANLPDDRPCLNCGYNIRGLSSDGACPECGTPIARSLRGNLLVYSSPEYVASLHRGLILILISVLAGLGLFLLAIPLLFLEASMIAQGTMTRGMVQPAMTLLAVPVAMVSLVGWWMFSAPDPAMLGPETGGTPRRFVRATVIVSAAASVFSFVTTSVPMPGGAILEGAAAVFESVAGIVQFFASLLYIRWLGPRLPDQAIIDRASQYMWLLPLIFIVGACVVVGPLVAMLMYYLFLNQVRLRLKHIREQQARDEALAGTLA